MSNGKATRYRKIAADIVEYACSLAESGVHLIYVTAGEDPRLSATELKALFREVRNETCLPVMASIGLVDDSELLRDVDWYACYQETHNRELFARLRQGQDFDQRFDSKVSARRTQ